MRWWQIIRWVVAVSALPMAGCDISERPMDASAGPAADAGELDLIDAPVGDAAGDTSNDLRDGADGTDEAPADTPADPDARPGDPQVVITEVMVIPCAPQGEWVELANVGDEPVDLAGWRIRDERGELHRIETDEPLEVPAGGYFVLARSADPAENGGIEPDWVLADLRVDDTADEVVLVSASGASVDAVRWRDGWPIEACAALALSAPLTNPLANDFPGSWCSAETAYGEAGDYGTPGAPNPICRDRALDHCRLEAPLEHSLLGGRTVAVSALVREAGLTDATAGPDPRPVLRVEAGFGPLGSTPDDDWSWTPAAPDDGWVDGAEPGADRYVAELMPMAAGEYAWAFRASGDGGATFTACDAEAGDSSDGSADGYQPEHAGRLSVAPDPCAGDPCGSTPPEPLCLGDGLTRLSYGGPATCRAEAGEPVCEWTETTEDCDALAGTCQDGSCVGQARVPVAGEVVIAEILAEPAAELAPGGAWIELASAAADRLWLTGCELSDGDGEGSVLERLVLEPGERALVAAAASGNGELLPDATFSLTLEAGDALELTCGGVSVDAVALGAGFAIEPGVALALDPGAIDAASNDAAAAWCLALDRYYAGLGGPEGDHFGTPGQPNPSCAEPVQRCRLAEPADVTGVDEGAPVSFSLQVHHAGVTDRSSAFDGHAAVEAEVGYGPDGTTPDGGWTWLAADPAPAASDESGDGYAATFAAPAAGEWDVAGRVTIDGGRNVTFCDRAAGPGMDGSEDGYAPAEAGRLATLPGVPNLIFGEYVEGSMDNKAVEIRSLHGANVDLSVCAVRVYYNGSGSPQDTIALAGVELAPGAVWVLCNGNAQAIPDGVCDQDSGNLVFNGNDAVELFCDETAVDVIGQIGFDPGARWGVAPTATQDATLRRACGVSVGDRNAGDAFDPAAEWTGFARDTFDGLGVSECE